MGNTPTVYSIGSTTVQQHAAEQQEPSVTAGRLSYSSISTLPNCDQSHHSTADVLESTDT